MAITAQCPTCGHSGNVPNQVVGRQVKCPQCAGTFTVKAAEQNGAAKQTVAQTLPQGAETAIAPAGPTATGNMITAQCACGFTGKVPERFRGKLVKCRQCGQMFTVSGDAPAPAETPAKEEPVEVEEVGLAPLEEKKPVASDDVVEVECEVIEDVEVVSDPACPVCGTTVSNPGNAPGKKLRCPDCCTLFNADGSDDDELAKKTGGSQAGTAKKAGGSQPGTQPAEAEEATPSLWSSLDEPEPKKPRPKKPAPPPPDTSLDKLDRTKPSSRGLKRKRSSDEESARQRNLAIVIVASGLGIVVLAGGLALTAYLMSSSKPAVAAVKTSPTPTPPSRMPATFPRVIVKKDPPPVQPPTRPEPPPDRPDPPPPPPDKPDPPPIPKAGEWADVSVGACKFGDIRLKVNSVWIDDITTILRGKNVGIVEDVLVVDYTVENLGQRGLNYLGWGGQNANPGEPTAVLTDNNGRLYRRMVLEAVEGQVETEMIERGKKTADRLLFGSPEDKVDYYRLELPARNFGGTGSIRLQIPKDMVQAKLAKKDPMPKEENKKLATLREQLKKPLAPDRIRACTAIGDLRAEGAPAVPDLMKLLKTEKDSNVRVAIVEAFGFIGAGARDAVPMLIDSLKDEFWMVRRESATSLGILGVTADQAKKAIPLLTKMVESKDEGVSDAARNALRRMQKN